MLKPMRYSARLALFSGLALAAVNAQALNVPGPLTDTEWLAKHLDQVTLLDVRKDTASYAEAHIPNAVLLNWKDVRVKRQVDGEDLIKLIPTKEEFEQMMRAAGVNNDSAVVITSKGKSSSDMTFATRLYWTFKYYGFDNVSVLNGGAQKWLGEKRPSSSGAVQAKAGNFSAGSARPELLATRQEVKDNSGQLLDGRAPEYYTGTQYKDSCNHSVQDAKNSIIWHTLKKEPRNSKTQCNVPTYHN